MYTVLSVCTLYLDKNYPQFFFFQAVLFFTNISMCHSYFNSIPTVLQRTLPSNIRNYLEILAIEYVCSHNAVQGDLLNLFICFSGSNDECHTVFLRFGSIAPSWTLMKLSMISKLTYIYCWQFLIRSVQLELLLLILLKEGLLEVGMEICGLKTMLKDFSIGAVPRPVLAPFD